MGNHYSNVNDRGLNTMATKSSKNRKCMKMNFSEVPADKGQSKQ